MITTLRRQIKCIRILITVLLRAITYTMIIFVYHSSAFNSMTKIHDFLLNRPQVVKIGGHLSSSLILSCYESTKILKL